MNAPSVDIQSILYVAWLKSGLPLSEQMQVYVGKEPASPHKVVTIYDTTGFEPTTNNGLDTPTVQIRVRSEPGDYVGGYALAQRVQDLLHAYGPYTVGGTYYLAIIAQQGIEHIGYDEQNRPLFVMNYRLHREGPTAGTNRG